MPTWDSEQARQTWGSAVGNWRIQDAPLKAIRFLKKQNPATVGFQFVTTVIDRKVLSYLPGVCEK